MPNLDTSYINRCTEALQKALEMLNTVSEGSIEYDIYRSACVKEFEIILEQSGKLLKKVIKPYFASSKEVDKMFYKDIFRFASNHSIISIDEVERWLQYRDNRNNTAHDYGSGFANDTIKLLPQFIIDAQSLIHAINSYNNANS